VKTIEKRKPIYAHVFVTALLLTLLLSLLTGIVAAPKPDKPGKPARPGKPVETWDLTIRIGIGNDDDIVLAESDYQDQDGYYLFAEDVPCSGGLWTFPEPKGKSDNGRYVNEQFSLYKWYNHSLGDWVGDYYATYALEHVEGVDSDGVTTWLDGFNHNNPGYTMAVVGIGHQVDRLGQDFWWFGLVWMPDPPDPNIWETYAIMAWTNKDGNPEVTPTEGDVLLVPFNGAEAMLYSDWTDEDPQDGVPDNYDYHQTTPYLSYFFFLDRKL